MSKNATNMRRGSRKTLLSLGLLLVCAGGEGCIQVGSHPVAGVGPRSTCRHKDIVAWPLELPTGCPACATPLVARSCQDDDSGSIITETQKPTPTAAEVRLLAPSANPKPDTAVPLHPEPMLEEPLDLDDPRPAAEVPNLKSKSGWQPVRST